MTIAMRQMASHKRRTEILESIETPRSQELNLNLTGTLYDTEAKLSAVGVQLSSVVPFADILRFTVSGTWAHSAGNGWRPASAINNQGPGILIPCRGSNFELEVVFDFTPSAIGEMFSMVLGYLTTSNHFGIFSRVSDVFGASSSLRWDTHSNDGDDTTTLRYNGVILAGVGQRTIRIRSKNATFGVWDDQDNAWHDYEGHQSAGIAYTAGYVFIQPYKITGATFTQFITLENIKLTYLL